MADSKKSADKPKAAKPRAAESSNPAVHQLIAERHTAFQNDDKAAMARLDKQIEDLLNS